MTEAENKLLIQRFYDEVWDRGNVAFAQVVFHDDYVRHDLRPTPAAPGAAGQAATAAFRTAFPDAHSHVDLRLAEGDLVAARWTATGTFTGGWGAVRPTGRSTEFSGVNLFRFRGSKVAEIWNHRDDLGLRQQAGAPIYARAAADDRIQAAESSVTRRPTIGLEPPSGAKPSRPGSSRSSAHRGPLADVERPPGPPFDGRPAGT